MATHGVATLVPLSTFDDTSPPQPQQLTPMKDGQLENMKLIAGNWMKFLDPALLGKRDVEPAASHPDEPPCKKVRCLEPVQGGQWYLGRLSQSLYIRSVVEDVGKTIFSRIETYHKRKKEGYDVNSAVFVISGSAGIGNSWSINFYVSELLKRNLRILLHLGEYETAYLIENNKDPRPCSRQDMINFLLDEEIVYEYDSPGSKKANSAAELKQWGISLIFSPPKPKNYAYALSKNDGYRCILNVPVWTKAEMNEIIRTKDTKQEELLEKILEASFSIWGGNLRALRILQSHVRVETDLEAATATAVAQIDAQIACFNAELVSKITTRVERQEVVVRLNPAMWQDAPGHILVPEPISVDTNNSLCFEEFCWRFCSPFAEKKFVQKIKTDFNNQMSDLLKSVFAVPSPRRVLFEKVSHLLITSGASKGFKSCNYIQQKNTSTVSFPDCNIVEMDTTKKNLAEYFEDALSYLIEQQQGNKNFAIALEPKDTISFDAVDMFVLVKGAKDWKFYMLQDTIVRKLSFHPIKVLLYCETFIGALKKVCPTVEDSQNILNDVCSYIAVVPNMTDKFTFEKASGSAEKDELDRVGNLINYSWPTEFNQGSLQSIVTNLKLNIPNSPEGGPTVLTKLAVQKAHFLEECSKQVLGTCQIIFNVVNQDLQT